MTEPLKRVHAGRVNGVHAPIGSILGPKQVTKELVVVTNNDERGVTLGYATTEDLDRIIEEPRTVAEFRALELSQKGVRAQLRQLFGR